MAGLAAELNGRRFVTISNAQGLSSAATIFRYEVDGHTITGHYAGGDVDAGRVVGRITGPSSIELLFQCVANDQRLLAGRSSGTVGRTEDGRLTLEFEWSWLAGSEGGGRSSYVELI